MLSTQWKKIGLHIVKIGWMFVICEVTLATPTSIFFFEIQFNVPSDGHHVKNLNFVIKITLHQKQLCFIGTNLCKKVFHRQCVIKFQAGKVSEHSKNNWCKVKGQSQNMHSGWCSPSKRYVWVSFEWPIRNLEIRTWSLRLRWELHYILI